MRNVERHRPGTGVEPRPGRGIVGQRGVGSEREAAGVGAAMAVSGLVQRPVAVVLPEAPEADRRIGDDVGGVSVCVGSRAAAQASGQEMRLDARG